MIIKIKQIILEGFFSKAKPFNVGPSLGQQFLKNVQNVVQQEKSKVKKQIATIVKLQELQSRPGFGSIDINPPKPPKNTPTQFKSYQMQLRDKNNPYNYPDFPADIQLPRRGRR